MKTVLVFVLTLAAQVCLVAANGASPGDCRPRVAPEMRIPAPGAVRPRGWLLETAKAQRDGATGRMDEIDRQFKLAWAETTRPRGKDLSWSADPGAWSCEGGAYWFEGLVKLAWQLDDPNLKELASNRLDTVLSKMPARPIGFCWWLDRDDQKCVDEVKVDNWLLWVAGMFERPVAAWYEATGDARVPTVLSRVFDGHVFGYFNRSTTPSAAVDAFRLTGNDRIAAANELHFGRVRKGTDFLRPVERQYYAPPPKYMEETLNIRRRHQGFLGLPTRHGVIASETLLSVFRTYQWTGDTNLLAAVRGWYAFFDTHMRQPYGVTTMDEEWGFPGPGRGTETCVVAAEGWNRINFMAALGEGAWGDDVERNFLNAGLNCATPDYRRHVYMQQPNRTEANDLLQCSFSGDPGETLGCYDSRHWPLCCTAALNRILPNYVQSMWMLTSDGGVAATLYGPCAFATEFSCGRFAVTEETDYPRDETIVLRIEEASGKAMPLWLRIPHWCAKAEVCVSGERIPAEMPHKGFVRCERNWRTGDVVTMRFPMVTEFHVMRDHNLGQGDRPYGYYTRGPLLLAKPIPTENANDPTEPVVLPCVTDRTDPATLGLVPYAEAKLRVSMFPIAEECGR